MLRRLVSAALLALISICILLYPWAGNYHSPTMWICAERTADRDIDVFLIGATSTLGDDRHFSSTTCLPEDRLWQKNLLTLQETLYRPAGRIFAPYYRQVRLSTYYLDDADRGPYFRIAYQDVRSAFLYYLRHENQGRPFILAGYSQGADMGLRLMEEFFDDPALQSQLVTAYLIGWRVTEEDLRDFPQLQMAQGETDTGVIVSFNSEAPGLRDSIIVPEGGYTYGINPINWRADGTPADRTQHPGSAKLHLDGTVDQIQPQLTGCYQSTQRGTLIVPDISPEDYPPGQPLFAYGCYHNYELELYFCSLKKNIADRCSAYQQLHGT